MLYRILEQKTALIAFCSDHPNRACLEINQWKILEKLVLILKNFVDCTHSLSSNNVFASAIIPNMKVICHFFEKAGSKGLFAGLGSTLSAWKNSVKDRFDMCFTNKNLILARYLDPRFKTFLEEEHFGENAEQILLKWMVNDILDSVSEKQDPSVSSDSDISPVECSGEEEVDLDFNFADCFNEFKKKEKKKQIRYPICCNKK